VVTATIADKAFSGKLRPLSERLLLCWPLSAQACSNNDLELEDLGREAGDHASLNAIIGRAVPADRSNDCHLHARQLPRAPAGPLTNPVYGMTY
jgi:hypothetical protein